MAGIKNILMVIETGGPGGAETVLLQLARYLDPKRYNPRVVLLKTGWLSSQLNENNVETVIIPSKRSCDILFLAQLIREVRNFKADIIHSHLPGANLYSCLAGALTRTPVITTYHGELFLPGDINKYSGLKYMLLRSLASRIVLVADYLRHDFVNIARFPEEKLSVIYNGISIGEHDQSFDSTSKRASLEIKPDEPVVGIVANLRPPKGYEYFIESCWLVTRELPGVKFLVVGQGEGKIRQKLEELISQYQLQDNVRLLGFRSDVPELLRIFDIFVLSSISEGLPLSAVEAMAACKPVVATKVGGLPELVKNGESGFLVPPKDASSLAEKILLVLNDSQLRATMGQKGRQIVASTFSVENMVNNYQQLYEKLTA